MKHFFSVCLLLVVFCNGVAADDLWLIKDGQPFATIVGPEKATPGQTKAAEWLVNYAEKVTDTTLLLYRLIVVKTRWGDHFRGADGASDGCESVQS